MYNKCKTSYIDFRIIFTTETSNHDKYLKTITSFGLKISVEATLNF